MFIRYIERQSQPRFKNVKRIKTGKINIGTEEDPVMVQGVEYEFDGEPTAEQLKELDRFYIGLNRDGGKSLADEIDELKAVASIGKINGTAV